jgi:ferredoxin-fold anticodon binding domain-containing protein
MILYSKDEKLLKKFEDFVKHHEVLQKKQKTVIIMRLIEKRTFQNIANILNGKESTIRHSFTIAFRVLGYEIYQYLKKEREEFQNNCGCDRKKN